MSDLKATVSETPQGFHVEGYEKIEYDFTFVDGVFDVANTGLADCYKKWGRVLAVTDKNIFRLYGQKMEQYFKHHELELKVHTTSIGEKAKNMDTLLGICDSMTEFGIIRKVCTLTQLICPSRVVAGRTTNTTCQPTGTRPGCWRRPGD
jgi:3-dehydroquinate synthase